MHNKIRGNYLAFEFPLLDKSEFDKTDSGIKKKIYQQFSTLELYGYDMHFYNPYIKNNILKRRIRRRLPLFFLTQWDEKDMYEGSIEFEYIRKPWHMDGDLICHLKRIKRQNSNCKIILEIPTYPYDNEHHTLSMKPLIFKDKFWRQKLNKYVDRIATYSDDDSIFGIQTIKIANAFDTNSVSVANFKHYDSNNIHIMLCATLAYWHGYDRAIEGLKNYYDNGGSSNIVLHIVGDGEEKKFLYDLIQKYKLESHAIMHGSLFGSGLDEVYKLCDLAFDSMGRHRSGVFYNSSLKGKEYAARGLPIVSGVKTELDSDLSFHYYYRVDASDSPINFFDIVSFCDEIYSNSTVENIRSEIRYYAEEHFTYQATFQKVVDYINN